MLVFSFAGAPLSISQDANRAVNLFYCRSPRLSLEDRKALSVYGETALVINLLLCLMFHWVLVYPKDIDALRFLWYPDGDFNKEPEECWCNVLVEHGPLVVQDLL